MGKWHEPPRNYRAAKRVLDIIGSLCGLVCLFLMLPVLCILIKLDTPGPVFFIQTRVGQFGKRFKFIKFRTMAVGAHVKQWELDQLNETGGLTFKISNDPRVTRIGRWLRRSSIDEMPQFWNVLRGEMSLVGPRPPLLDEISRYSDYQKIRMTVPQGMTGLWQVRGRSNLGIDLMADLDVWYACNAGLCLDLHLLSSTIPAVLLGRGAH